MKNECDESTESIEWDEEEGKWTGRSGQNQRKRGKKKKKGDKNNVQDVMREVERQRGR